MPVIDLPVRPARERDVKIKRLLQSPDAELVSLVTGLVNLTEAEKTAVDLCLPARNDAGAGGGNARLQRRGDPEMEPEREEQALDGMVRAMVDPEADGGMKAAPAGAALFTLFLRLSSVVVLPPQWHTGP